MIHTHESALLRIAELRELAAAERLARELTEHDSAERRTDRRAGSRPGRRSRKEPEDGGGRPPRSWSTAA